MGFVLLSAVGGKAQPAARRPFSPRNRRAISARRLAGAFVLVLAVVTTGGCRRDTEAIAPLKTAGYRVYRGAERDSAAGDPRYVQAAALFRAKDYARARTLIEGMLAEPGWTAGERDFLLRQRDICANPIRSGPRTAPAVRGARRAVQADCGPRALAIVLEALGRRTTVERLRRLAGTDGNGTTFAGLQKAATESGQHAEAVQMDLPALEQWDGKGIAWVDGDHYVAVLRVEGDQARIHDPNRADEETIDTEALLRRGGGIVMRVGP